MFSSVIWPTVAFCLSTNSLGWGLGLITSLVNGGGVLGGLIFGWIRGNWGEAGVIDGLKVVCIAMAIQMVIVWWFDSKN